VTEPRPQDDRNIVAEVTRILAETKGVPTTAVRPETRLEDLGIDSLAVIQISVALEETLGFAVRDEDRFGMLDVETVAELTEFVTAQIAARAEASR